jgi:hypothetical protein
MSSQRQKIRCNSDFNELATSKVAGSYYRRIIMEVQYVEIVDLNVKIESIRDALDMMANANTDRLIIHEQSLPASFFDLKTGLAGDILQKFVQYGMIVAIVGDFEKYNSKSLNAFIIECNRGRSIFFVGDVDTAFERLKTTADSDPL